ncbi:CDP-glycerol glycerophosphotransferase family protein [Enterococcus sp. BWT-B8]|uniref:CDP-glycerol glycerophosphotransferase family protein n=1 Tax=Enterococcus sp. BWT-B8 TaxID=2885157 RepID=UPI001E3E4E18|nr:CDP-glycerol glycerophosphotransferase family protein [Enterococcus sp. BWT-B8]MCB5952925.1 CDP-glycerol glycerophosphotransferase family protein [Enterococcus sp. BWT-B8]
MEYLAYLKINVLKLIFSVLYLFWSFVIPFKKNSILFCSSRSEEMSPSMQALKDGLSLQAYGIFSFKQLMFNRKGTKSSYLKNCFKATKLIAESEIIILDDHFFPVNALIYKQKKNQVIQIWHAAGTIKHFGNSLQNKKNFIPHKNYDLVCVNSEKDRKAYAEALGVSIEQTMATGAIQLELAKKIYEEFPYQISEKIKIFYAPTYRKGNEDYSLHLIQTLIKLFEEEMPGFELKLSVHPYVQSKGVSDDYIVRPDQLYEELLSSDLLITDYSSLMIDYSITERPILIWTPDLEEYEQNVGFFNKNFFVKYDFFQAIELSDIQNFCIKMKKGTLSEKTKHLAVDEHVTNNSKAVETINEIILKICLIEKATTEI